LFFSDRNTVKVYAIVSVILIVVGSILLYYPLSSLPSPSSASPSDSSPLSTQSPQWAGYVVMSNLILRQSVVTSVRGSWTVPAIESSGNDKYSAVWVGIGGYGEQSLIQTGTMQQFVNGEPTYYAWYELLPNRAVRILNVPVQPGDKIMASVNLVEGNANSWSVEISDVTSGDSFQKTFSYASSRLSAEWVVESPTVSGNISTLANFGSIVFSDCYATVDNETGTISSFPGYQVVMYSQGGEQLVTVSQLNSDGSGFTVNYLETQNAANTTGLPRENQKEIRAVQIGKKK
jgi:hypothetical protein